MRHKQRSKVLPLNLAHPVYQHPSGNRSSKAAAAAAAVAGDYNKSDGGMMM